MGNKTIRELATNFNISKEAIYKKINYSMKEELKEHISKENNKTYITPQGQSIILQSLKREIEVSNQNNEVNTPVDNQSDKVDNQVDNQTNIDYIKHLENEIDYLKKQIEIHLNDKEHLYEINKSLADTINITKKLETGMFISDKGNQIVPIDKEEDKQTEQPKRKFFNNFFKR